MNILHAGYTAKVNGKCIYPAAGFGLAHSVCRNTEGCKNIEILVTIKVTRATRWYYSSVNIFFFKATIVSSIVTSCGTRHLKCHEDLYILQPSEFQHSECASRKHAAGYLHFPVYFRSVACMYDIFLANRKQFKSLRSFSSTSDKTYHNTIYT